MLLAQTADNFDGGVDRLSIEWDLGQGNDGDDDDENDVQRIRITCGANDVGCDLVADTIAEHDIADDSH